MKLLNTYNPIVYVVDDDPLICQAISWLLSTVSLPVEMFSDAQAFLNIYDTALRGCIIIDVRMPGMSGLELQQELNQRVNAMPILMISGHGDVPMAVRAMQAGAKDFILKPFNDQLLLEKIQAAIKVDSKNQILPDTRLIAERFALLTPRERQVLDMVVTGKLNKQIAIELNISISTVEVHRSQVMRKLQVKTLAEVMAAYLHTSKIT